VATGTAAVPGWEFPPLKVVAALSCCDGAVQAFAAHWMPARLYRCWVNLRGEILARVLQRRPACAQQQLLHTEQLQCTAATTSRCENGSELL
jgi:hypothetical protein